jgi:hypothetical protein
MLHSLRHIERLVEAVVFTAVVGGGAAFAQSLDARFTDATNDGKAHISGFVCPAKIGIFERNAVGEKDLDDGADFCAYSAFGGVYGTIVLTPLGGAYDPKASLANEFSQEEGIGAKRVGEASVKLTGTTQPIYTRTYETSALETMHYKLLYSGAAVGNWAVETTIEFFDPRDTPAQKEFLTAVYAAAQKQIAVPKPAPASPIASTPLAASTPVKAP